MHRWLSLLLQYPDDALLGQLGTIREAAAELPAQAGRDALLQFLRWLENQSPGAVRTLYADTFDFSDQTTLYLTYFRYGDLRERGQVLADLKALYAEAGYVLEGNELPDYLPLMLEFAAEAPESGLPLLQAYRGPIEAIRKRLAEMDNPYRHLFEALCVSLGCNPMAERS